MWYLSRFLEGFKPALNCSSHRYAPETFAKLDPYPQVLTKNASLLFFQTQEQKNRFLYEADGISPYTLQYHKLLGLTLGYPPQAIDFYLQTRHYHTRDDIEIASKKIFLHYCGMSCIANLEHLVEDVSWFWRTYQHPSTTVVGIVCRDLPSSPYVDEINIPYGDDLRLQQLQKQLQEERERYLLREISLT